MPGCVIILPKTVSPKTVSERLDLSFGIFARRGEKYSCYESTFSDDLCMKPQKSLRARAMDILSRQEISRVGLKRKLAPHAESEEELENVLNEFAERNWQSDQRYAEAYIHSKSSQHGSLRLKQALAQQGIDETVSREFMPDKACELQTAVAVLRKKFKQPATDLKDKQKQARFLAYRGFDMDTIHAALKSSWDEEVFDASEE